jgi:hypothetical protein
MDLNRGSSTGILNLVKILSVAGYGDNSDII